MTIPVVRKDPEEMAAAISVGRHTTSASASTSFLVKSVSKERVSWPAAETTRWVSTFAAAPRACRRRTP